MGTFKIYLTAEKWAQLCDLDEDVALEVAKQQPELAAELGYHIEEQPAPSPVVKKTKKGKGKGGDKEEKPAE